MTEEPQIVFNAEDFDFKPDLSAFASGAFDLPEYETRYIKPPYRPDLAEEYLLYKNAAKLANDLTITRGSRHYAIVDGSFIFGDFLEALLVEKNIHAKEMTVSTLSMNENNADSFANLIRGGFVDRLNLIISAYFFSHERNGMIKYLYETCDIDNRFQLAVCSSHCKLAMFETEGGAKVVIHGSANLRSSSNMEQMMIEENPELYDFNHGIHARIIETYRTIDHQVRRNTLWKAVKGD